MFQAIVIFLIGGGLGFLLVGIGIEIAGGAQDILLIGAACVLIGLLMVAGYSAGWDAYKKMKREQKSEGRK